MKAAGQSKLITSMNMSRPNRRRVATAARNHAPVFAALGDETRLALVARLADGRPCSITELTSGTRISRQAITKHLRVLETAGMVRHKRAGRESRFAFNPAPIHEIRDYLEGVSSQWDETLR